MALALSCLIIAGSARLRGNAAPLGYGSNVGGVGGAVNPAENYQKLREWYLARLRNLAQNAASSAMYTPAQLIALDKETVKLLVQSRSASKVEEPKKAAVSPQQLIVVLLMVFLIVGTGMACVQGHWLYAGSQSLAVIACAFLLNQFHSKRQSQEKAAQALLSLKRESASATATVSVDLALDKLSNQLDELNQRESSIADFAKSVIVCFDKELTIDSISPACMVQWGHHQFELLGSNLNKIIFHEDADRFKKSLRTDQPAELVTRLRKQDNSVIDVAWFVEWSSQFQKFFATADDVTDRMMLERARQEFITQLTHDMRSPLNGVAMTLDMVNDGILGRVPDKVADSLGRAQKGLSCVVELINDILDAEKIRTRQGKIEVSSLNMHKLARSVMDALQVVADERKVRLELIGEDHSCVADPKLIRRVLHNLVNNAISFSPEESCVTVRLEGVDDNVKVSVIDRGPGIHHDYHLLIFERFGVVPQAEKNNRVSSGLGLWICRDIIRAHSGFIGVESKPGEGSNFWFLLPVNQ